MTIDDEMIYKFKIGDKFEHVAKGKCVIVSIPYEDHYIVVWLETRNRGHVNGWYLASMTYVGHMDENSEPFLSFIEDQYRIEYSEASLALHKAKENYKSACDKLRTIISKKSSLFEDDLKEFPISDNREESDDAFDFGTCLIMGDI